MSITIESDVWKGKRGWRLASEVSLSAPLDEVFPFFSRAHNLNELTPPSLPFRILTPEPIEMAEELLIEYRLRVKGMPVRWTSEISVWNPPHRFVDEQKRGPYRWWHHEHVFEPTDGGTIARDVVHYGVLGGALVHSLVVKRDLMTIFTYRHRKMIELFGLLSPQPNNPS